MFGFIDRWRVQHWRRRANAIQSCDLPTLREERSKALHLRQVLEELITVADLRLSDIAPGNPSFALPYGTNWFWRPETWFRVAKPSAVAPAKMEDRLGENLRIYHDCPNESIVIKQLRGPIKRGCAPYVVAMDVFDFRGSFLSVVINLPPEGVDGLTCNHVVRIDLKSEFEFKLESYMRLNIKHGPNKAQIAETIELTGDDFVEFDLSYTKFNEKRVESAWVELIFTNPSMNMIRLNDMRFSRRLRADM